MGGHTTPTLGSTANDESRVPGTVFEITDAELASADEFEKAFFYKRVAATLASGRQVWVYVDADGAPDNLSHVDRT